MATSDAEPGTVRVDVEDAIGLHRRPIPYSPPLEDAFLPGAIRIAAEVIARRG